MSDWSSDACSSDLRWILGRLGRLGRGGALRLLAWNRHERIDPGAVLLLRHLRAEAELRAAAADGHIRSDERRVGYEWVCTCRSRWSPYRYNKKTISSSATACVDTNSDAKTH